MCKAAHLTTENLRLYQIPDKHGPARQQRHAVQLLIVTNGATDSKRLTNHLSNDADVRLQIGRTLEFSSHLGIGNVCLVNAG
jgi:hypothetical protein